MVSETLLRTLNDAFIQAGNKRDRIQVEVNKQRERVNVARANLEHAQTRETNLVQQNQRKKAECKELVDHYNGLVDKSGLNAIQEWINELTAQQTEIHRRLQEAQEIRRQRYSELQQTETDLAVAEQNLGKALKDWQRMSAELKRARNEE